VKRNSCPVPQRSCCSSAATGSPWGAGVSAAGPAHPAHFRFAIRLETKRVPDLVQDFDRSPLSAAYTDRPLSPPPVQGRSLGWAAATRLAAAIRSGLRQGGGDHPAGIQQPHQGGQAVGGAVAVDGTDANNAG